MCSHLTHNQLSETEAIVLNIKRLLIEQFRTLVCEGFMQGSR